MKLRGFIYFIIGVILVVINLLTDLVALSEISPNPNSFSFNFGYFIGSHIFLIFGLILLRLAYKLKKKIRKIEEDHLEDSINNIGKG